MHCGPYAVITQVDPGKPWLVQSLAPFGQAVAPKHQPFVIPFVPVRFVIAKQKKSGLSQSS